MKALQYAHVRAVAALAAFGAVVACNETALTPRAPQRAITPSFSLVSVPTPVVEQLTVCKDGSSATFSITVSGVAGNDFTLQDGECSLVDTHLAGQLTHNDVVTEQVPSGTVLDSIVDNGTHSLHQVVTGFNSIAVKVGNDQGHVLVFYNRVLPRGSIGDFVWSDLNGNGIQDAGEPGIPGVTVTLSGAASGTSTTDANGAYLFTDLGAGNYTVTTSCPNGSTMSPSGQGGDPSKDSNGSPANVNLPTNASSDLTIDFGCVPPPQNACEAGPTGVNLGSLTNWLFIFTDGHTDANWQGATKGYVGNVGVDGILASERTSGGVPYAGTIYTNDVTLGAWWNIVNQSINAGQAFGSTGNTALITSLRSDLLNAMSQINALSVTAGYASRTPASLNGLNTQNGVPETFVINVTSGFQVSSKINITGDPGDFFILRWDTDANSANGYQGQVKFQSGGAIVPLGGLTAANFIHVAGDINASGGGSNPPAPYPQGPRFGNGQGALINGGANWNGGGFFTGYWLTTGDPSTGQTASLSNAIFVGGWYSTTTKFSMTSGTSGVHVVCP